jgi:hypothetical protein
LNQTVFMVLPELLAFPKRRWLISFSTW